MKRSIFKSIGAILAGIVLGAVLSIATDKILESIGVLVTEPFDTNPTWLIAIIVVYRSLYNIAGAYLTAKLAPNQPMKHSLILGIIGLVVSIVGTIVMWHIPPHWYPISLIILTMPATYLGGKLAT